MIRRRQLLAATGAALAAPAAAQAPQRLTLVLDWFVNPDHGPLFVAQELGYFREAGLEDEEVAELIAQDVVRQG